MLKKRVPNGPGAKDMPEPSMSLNSQTDSALEHPKTSTVNPIKKPFTCLDDIPLSIFVMILCSGDTNHLGHNTSEENETFWAKIHDEWEVNLSTERSIAEIQTHAEIKRLELDISRVKTIVLNAYNLGVTDEIQELLLDEGFVATTKEDLPDIINQLTTWEVRMELLIQQVEALLPTNKEKDTKVDKALFVKCCVRISDYKKYPITLQSITALEFCIHYRDYIDYIEKLKK